MNRAEKRALGLKGKNKPQKEPIINIKVSEIEAIKQNAVEKACNLAFFLMLAIPTMVIHDKFGEIMKREGREERFANHVIELYDSYQKGYVSFNDLRDCLEQETGLRMEDLKI